MKLTPEADELLTRLEALNYSEATTTDQQWLADIHTQQDKIYNRLEELNNQ